MSSQKKIRVGLLFGGQSSEHEVSLLSAYSVLQNLDLNRYEIELISIDGEGRWQKASSSNLKNVLNSKELKVFADEKSLFLSLDSRKSPSLGVDVVFPVLHGPLYEDGAIQGFLETLGVPYVGTGVLGSALGMDKEVAKRLVASHNIQVTPGVCLRGPRSTFTNSEAVSLSEKFGWPLFVKPANQGSSVGVGKATDLSSLVENVHMAFRFDSKVLVEQGIDAREIELSVLESKNVNDVEPRVSLPGEILPQDFYSYEAKYLNSDGALLKIPAELTSSQVLHAQQMAKKIFQILELEGLARVDLFLDRKSNQFYFNEVNTLPGFTSISMYPKLWEASGLSYSCLLDELIDLALLRHQKRESFQRNRDKSFHVPSNP